MEEKEKTKFQFYIILRYTVKLKFPKSMKKLETEHRKYMEWK